MTYAGARGRTAQQMAEVLRFSLPDDRLHPAFGELIQDLDAVREGYELRIANRLFGQKEFAFRQPFLDLTGEHYSAPLESLDFVKNPDGSREHINHWVEEKTNGKIRDLLPEGSIRDTTRLVLTNAIYFNGKWKYKFDKDDTRDELFYAADGTASNVEMMFQKGRFRYGKFDGFQLLEMPYAGDDLSMVVMLPDAMDGLPALEASLTPDLIEKSLAAMWERDVLVHLPKFKFEATFGLGGTLQDMGMVDAFESADFSGIGDGGLAISDVLHKAFIDVNEAGTEAAAATAVIIGVTDACFDCSPPPPPVFRADHPFLFVLRDMHSGSLMFLGRVTQPGESEIGQFANVPEPGTMILLTCILPLVPRLCRRA
jgi:serpin B